MHQACARESMSRSDRLYGEVLIRRFAIRPIDTTNRYLSVMPLDAARRQPLMPPRWSDRSPALDIFLHGNIIIPMPRAATTSDVFNADRGTASARHPRLSAGAGASGRRTSSRRSAWRSRRSPSTCACCAMSAWSMCGRDGRQVFYRTNADGIRPLHEWTDPFRTLLETAAHAHQGTRRAQLNPSDHRSPEEES